MNNALGRLLLPATGPSGPITAGRFRTGSLLLTPSAHIVVLLNARTHSKKKSQRLTLRWRLRGQTIVLRDYDDGSKNPVGSAVPLAERSARPRSEPSGDMELRRQGCGQNESKMTKARSAPGLLFCHAGVVSAMGAPRKLWFLTPRSIVGPEPAP